MPKSMSAGPQRGLFFVVLAAFLGSCSPHPEAAELFQPTADLRPSQVGAFCPLHERAAEEPDCEGVLHAVR